MSNLMTTEDISVYTRINRALHSGVLYALECRTSEAVHCGWSQCDVLLTIAKHCPNMQKLSLACQTMDYDLEKHVVEILQNCPGIYSIGVIPGSAFPKIDQCLPRLIELSAIVNKCDEIPALARTCWNLQSLELEQRLFVNSCMHVAPILEFCTQLQSCALWGFSLNFDDLCGFSNLQDLSELFLYTTDTSDQDCEVLAQTLPATLKRLKLSGCETTTIGLRYFVPTLVDIEELNIVYTGAGLDFIDLLKQQFCWTTSAPMTDEQLASERCRAQFAFPKLRHLSVRWVHVPDYKHELGLLRPEIVIDCQSYCCTGSVGVLSRLC
eukprot:28530_1